MQNNLNSQLESLLQRSQATPEFKHSVLEIAAGNPADCVSASSGSPPIKVLRVLMKCLEMYPQMPISRVDITDEVWKLRFLNATAHLPEELLT